jgi:hypothetical protein
MSLPAAPVSSLVVLSHTVNQSSQLSTAMSDDSPCSGYALVPIITRENYMRWEMQVHMYLMGAADHVHVIWCTRDATGRYEDLAPPSDPDECRA